MSKITKDEIISNLKYLGIESKSFPKFLMQYEPISFKTSRMQNDKDHKVFQYVPIDRIEILFTPHRRNDSIQEKYSGAVPLSKFLDFEDENDETSATLFSVLSRLNVEEIEKIEEFQNSLTDQEPFWVKFNKDHLWQIYYSNDSDRYFMLVCTKEDTFAEFFYLLKKKIEFKKSRRKKAPKIYVPINYINYSGNFLSTDEITDLENYIWYFTKEWPLVFEVYDTNNKLSFQVVGVTYVYEKIKSFYKLKFENKEEVIKFFKLVKALFIMQTEIKGHFNFVTEIDDNNQLQFSYRGNIITYDSLQDFIRDEYIYCMDAINEQIKESKKLNSNLSKLRMNAKQKEEEYTLYQNQISTYLNYKKTFFGKVKYYFKGSSVLNKKKKKKEPVKESPTQDYKNKIDMHTIDTLDTQKDFYTIEDLVVIYANREKNSRMIDDINNDTRAISLKLENLTNKVKNAKVYLEEIDNHRKSIFDFWRYANKDEKLALEEGSLEDTPKEAIKSVRKVFDMENDYQTYFEDMDLIQRKTLSKEELDALFVANSDLLDLLNDIRNNNTKKAKIEEKLDELKEKFENDRLIISKETFDIFGNIKSDNTKTQYIGSRSHREAEKDLLKIFNINKNTEYESFKAKLEDIVNLIDSANQKIFAKADMYLYKVVSKTQDLSEDKFEIFDVDIENNLRNFIPSDDSNITIIKIRFMTDYPINYYTNITQFDNTNQTLPLGMNLSTKALLDMSKFKFNQINKIRFKTNEYFNKEIDLIIPKAYEITLEEYDVVFDNKDPNKRNKTHKKDAD